MPVKRRQLADQQALRPAVAHDVVDAQQQGVVLRSQAQERGAEQRSVRQIERPARFLAREFDGAGQRVLPGFAGPDRPGRAAGLRRAAPAPRPAGARPSPRGTGCAGRRGGAPAPSGRAPGPRGPGGRSAGGPGTCCPGSCPGSSWSRNQKRCCANDSGADPTGSAAFFCWARRASRASFSSRDSPARLGVAVSLKPAPLRPGCRSSRASSSASESVAARANRSSWPKPDTGGWAAAILSSITEAIPSTVLFSKTRESGRSTPRVPRTRESTRVAVSEWPPRLKKLSRVPTRSTPRTSDQIPARAVSTGVRGSTYSSLAASSVAPSGDGRALRSTLPLGVSGSSGSSTKTDGTM